MPGALESPQPASASASESDVMASARARREALDELGERFAHPHGKDALLELADHRVERRLPFVESERGGEHRDPR